MCSAVLIVTVCVTLMSHCGGEGVTRLTAAGQAENGGQAARQVSHEGQQGRTRSLSKRAASTPERFWHKAVVPYEIEQHQTKRDIRSYHYAMHMVSTYTCIKFVPLDNSTWSKHGLDHRGYIQFNKKNLPWGFASLGNTKKPAQRVSCLDPENCVHEVLHALGFEHEQKDSSRKGIIRINWKAINPPTLTAYTEMHNQRDVNTSEPYDISSTLHYRLQYGNKAQMTMLFPELRIQHGNYYQFREVAEQYKCKEMFCPDFKLTCENDGYVNVRKGVCQCVCPHGLDPATGCQSINRAVNDGPFPGGHYGLPEHVKGCPPNENFKSGLLEHQFPGAYAFWPYLMKGSVSWHTVVQHFCIKDKDDNPFRWPKGDYCLYRVGGRCPPGMEEGWIQFDNKYQSSGPGTARTSGALPDGNFTQNTKLYFCCRTDGTSRLPMVFPNTKPFVLFPCSSGCQKVKGAQDVWREISVSSDTADNIFNYSAPKPSTFQRRSNTDPQLYIRYCAYYPINYDCGGIITLSDKVRRKVISSPNHPGTYKNNLECHWFIKGPEGSVLTLMFDEFDLEADDRGRCRDSVEINTYMFGQRGIQYCGRSMRRVHRSVLNTFHVTLRTDYKGQRKGFRAQVDVHLEDENCFNPADHGWSYRGRVNVTEQFTPCLPWSHPGLKDNCYHFATNPLDMYAGLDGNFCRNPGAGVRPWCYTNVTGCQRAYCDVCQLGRPYDVARDCVARVAADDSYCCKARDAREKCAWTCAPRLPEGEKPKPYTKVKCGSPPIPKDARRIALKKKYTMGDTVTFSCKHKDSTWKQTTTCLGDSTWTPIASVCTGCPDQWHPLKDGCVWTSPERTNFREAQKRCAAKGATLFEVRDQDSMNFLFHLRDDGMDQWLGLKEDGKGEWRWQDWTAPVWTKWMTGSRPSQRDPRRDYCAVLKFSDNWSDMNCAYHAFFSCRLRYQEKKPKAVSPRCKDKNPYCPYWHSIGECRKNPRYMHHNCAKSCGKCQDLKKCKGAPCGRHPCTVVSENGDYSCTCPVGHYGPGCHKTFPCVDRATQTQCRAKLKANSKLCTHFPEFAWIMCKKTCGKC